MISRCYRISEFAELTILCVSRMT